MSKIPCKITRLFSSQSYSRGQTGPVFQLILKRSRNSWSSSLIKLSHCDYHWLTCERCQLFIFNWFHLFFKTLDFSPFKLNYTLMPYLRCNLPPSLCVDFLIASYSQDSSKTSEWYSRLDFFTISVNLTSPCLILSHSSTFEARLVDIHKGVVKYLYYQHLEVSVNSDKMMLEVPVAQIGTNLANSWLFVDNGCSRPPHWLMYTDLCKSNHHSMD